MTEKDKKIQDLLIEIDRLRQENLDLKLQLLNYEVSAKEQRDVSDFV